MSDGKVGVGIGDRLPLADEAAHREHQCLRRGFLFRVGKLGVGIGRGGHRRVGIDRGVAKPSSEHRAMSVRFIAPPPVCSEHVGHVVVADVADVLRADRSPRRPRRRFRGRPTTRSRAGPTNRCRGRCCDRGCRCGAGTRRRRGACRGSRCRRSRRRVACSSARIGRFGGARDAPAGKNVDEARTARSQLAGRVGCRCGKRRDAEMACRPSSTGGADHRDCAG